jgi:hypothetical protein
LSGWAPETLIAVIWAVSRVVLERNWLLAAAASASARRSASMPAEETVRLIPSVAKSIVAEPARLAPTSVLRSSVSAPPLAR